jgi:hypothetical protein
VFKADSPLQWRDIQGNEYGVGLYEPVSHPKTVSSGAGGPILGPAHVGLASVTEPSEPRKLLIDIENRPNLMYVWDAFKPNFSPDGLVEPYEMISFAAKWHGVKETYFSSTYHDGKQAMLELLYYLMDKADIVIHYYGKRHDVPIINTELLLGGFSPPSPYRQIDLYDTVKHKFNFTYNKLGFVCEQLGLSGKAQSGGFQNWIKCIAGDADAWQTMMDYNIQDVITLEELYDKLLPWIPSHPNLALYEGKRQCPRCQSNLIQFRGYVHTNASRFRQIYCSNCGGWSRLPTRTSTVDIRVAADG